MKSYGLFFQVNEALAGDRGRAMRAAAPIVFFSLVMTVPAMTEPPVELYRRVLPIETTSGIVTLRESVDRQLEVPELCENGFTHCPAVRRFTHLYRIDFELETRKRSANEQYVEREGRGSVYLALAARREDEESYDELLREALSTLGAAAFDQPFAGMQPDHRPFGEEVALRAMEPSWSCFENGEIRNATKYRRDVALDEEGNESISLGLSTFRDEAVMETLCAELESATATAYPEEIRTMSTPGLLLEQTLLVDVSNLLLKEAFPGELVALPEGSDHSRKKVPGVLSSNKFWVRDGVVNAGLAVDGVETAARIMAAELSPAVAGGNAWHSRWVLNVVERRLGPLPESRLIERWELTSSLLPTPPPRDLDDPEEEAAIASDETHAVRLDEEALFESIARSIDFREGLSPDVLAGRIAGDLDGLGSPGWILVLCMPDGSASWGLPQAGAYADLLNGDRFCGAVESYLP
jgi:hypothetical protein